MAFSLRKWRAPAAVSLPDPAPFAVEMTDSESGPAKVNLEDTGAAAAEDPVMQFNISGTIGA